MSADFKIETLSFLDAATKQLNRAIVLFFDEQDFVSSLTLAGAAEEILGSLVSEAGGTTSLDSLVSYSLEFLDKDESDTKTKKSVISLENFFRNRLKHKIDDLGMGLTYSSDYYAAKMIDRAVQNYLALGQTPTPEIERFEKEVPYETRNKQINKGQG